MRSEAKQPGVNLSHCGPRVGFETGQCRPLRAEGLVALPAVEAAIASLVDGLPSALRRGDQAALLHARRLTTALQVPLSCLVVSLVSSSLHLQVRSCFC